MATPLRLDMNLPNGTPLRFDTPGARWDGTVEAVMAAQNQSTNNNMSSQNLVSSALTTAAVANITTAVATIRTNLPFLLNLSDAQRKSLQNITEASQGIAQATINFVAQHPEALPATFNLTEFNKDAALFAPFQQVCSLIASLNTDTQDTLRALHSDIYGETLDVYAFAQAGNRAGAYTDYINTVKTRFATWPAQNQARPRNRPFNPQPSNYRTVAVPNRLMRFPNRVIAVKNRVYPVFNRLNAVLDRNDPVLAPDSFGCQPGERGSAPQRTGSRPPQCGDEPPGNESVRTGNRRVSGGRWIYDRPHPNLLPGEKERPAHVFRFAEDRPANPVARIFRKAADDTPSPWGEGRDEGERSNQIISDRQAGSRAPGAPGRAAAGVVFA